MHSLRQFLAVTATIVAVVALAPVASAGSEKEFHLDKTCADDASEPLGYICTVQHSDFKWIPPGTDIRYLSESEDGSVVQASIEIKNGSTSGSCTWSSEVDAICVFNGGTGRLANFNLEVVVTANADQSVWYWDGTYWFDTPDTATAQLGSASAIGGQAALLLLAAITAFVVTFRRLALNRV